MSIYSSDNEVVGTNVLTAAVIGITAFLLVAAMSPVVPAQPVAPQASNAHPIETVVVVARHTGKMS